MVRTFCIIENGKVVNRAIADKPLADNWIEVEADIGDEFRDGKVTKAPKPKEPDPEPDKVDILVALLKEKNLITSEDATKVKRGKP
jgi:hypothetical protein